MLRVEKILKGGGACVRYLFLIFVSMVFIPYFCNMKTLREIIFSDEFDEFYESLAPRIREKYDYALDIVRTQYVLNKKFVKNLESSIFYELRISIGHDEYRSVIFAIDHDNVIQARRILLLNSFLKKDNKQYKAEIKTAEKLLKKYTEE